MARIDFEGRLNAEQLAAAVAPAGPILVLAAAGTGKTRTLVYRVAHLVQDGVLPEHILLLTFTNKAAKEMLERASELVGPGVSGIWGGTFHHMANRILRRHAGRIGFKSDYTIMDRDDSRTLMAKCVQELKLQGKEFPKPDVLLTLYGTAINTEMPLESVVSDRFAGVKVDPNDVTNVILAYQKEKLRIGAMDFDDLLVNCLKLLRENEQILCRYQERFEHVLVDEYQDTNKIQSELVDRIAKKNRSVFVVGDDFQSIYSWRGADFKNIMSFPQRYNDAKIFKLETNYRSVPEILNVANACIAGNPEQYQKTLRATREAYKKPTVVRLRDGDEQARYVVEQIGELQREGYGLSDIVVLYRAHYHSMELQMELMRANTHYVITSGMRFFEQAHIKDLCCLLRIMTNSSDELAFARLFALLPGIGARTAEKLWRKMAGNCNLTDPSVLDRLGKMLPAQAMASWKDIRPVFEAYIAEDLREDPGELIYKFIHAFYKRYMINTFENFERRSDDAQELVIHMAKYNSTDEFLSDVALLTNLDSETEDAGKNSGGAVRLSTVHQAKGLEWPVVFVIWATDGMFPSARSIAESEGAEAEERRLFYVAVTRARNELFLCVPEIRRNRDGSVSYHAPSRFIEEIPPDFVCESRPGFI
ncbi:MAG: ATP-dependent helicase [Lentisphaerae bacterium]|nr:ATP-dependent helicase [Lentisphaerota bacterium]